MNFSLLNVFFDDVLRGTEVGWNEVHLQQIKEVLLFRNPKLFACRHRRHTICHTATAGHHLPTLEDGRNEPAEGIACVVDGRTCSHKKQTTPVLRGSHEEVKVHAFVQSKTNVF